MCEKKQTGISSITIENFKGIGEKVTIPLKPITLLFGANSAGKSTILKSLAYLREAVKTWKHPEQIHISGETVATGDFRSVVHRHDEKRNIRIAVEVPRPESTSPGKEEKKKTRTWADAIEAMFSGFSVETLRIEVAVPGNQSVTAELWMNDEQILWVNSESIELNRRAGFVKKYFLEWPRRDEEDWFTKKELEHANLEFLLTPRDRIDFAKPWESYNCDIAPWSQELRVEAEEHAARKAYELCSVVFGGLDCYLGSQRYIGPLRKVPTQRQRFDVISPDDWYSGMAAWRELEMILRRKSPYNRYEFPGGGAVVSVAKQALEQIGRLQLDYQPVLKSVLSVTKVDAEIRELSARPEAPEQELDRLLKTGQPVSRSEMLALRSKDGVVVGPCDVGTGVSQALPIAVGAFAEGCRLMMVEQPELHLHPRLQCDLADVFVANTHRHPERKFIIETHSEHLILRLLRRIYETSEGKSEDDDLRLSPKELSVLYVKEVDGAVKITVLPVNNEGNFTEKWPGGFFGERVREVC